jgi:alpha-tubulin suppressor-like RCC1 family protein
VAAAAVLSLVAGGCVAVQVVSPRPASAVSQATAIAVGNLHSCELRSGAAYCWGYNAYGQLGNNTVLTSDVPVPVYTGGVLAGVTLTQITTGTSFTCALGSTGTAYCWGLGTSGQLGNGAILTSNVPVTVSGSLNLTQITAGGATACGLTSGGVAHCWGLGTSGQLGNGGIASSSVPVTVSGSLNVAQITAGLAFTCALTAASVAYCWGLGTTGELGNGTITSPQKVPTLVTATGVLSGVTLTQIAAGSVSTCALDSSGAAYCWGTNVNGEVGNYATGAGTAPVGSFLVPVAVLAPAGTLSAGTAHSCLLRLGKAYCWGDNTFGELGNGVTTPTPQSTPVAVNTTGVLLGKFLTQITTGNAFTCALSSTGSAYCWGLGTSGQLGNNTIVSSKLPVLVSGSLIFTHISAGAVSVCGVSSAGKAYCWGNNANGQLGTGTTTQSLVPILVTATTGTALFGLNMTQIEAGTSFACALASTGAAYCWGLNDNGQLGTGNTAQSLVPVAVTTVGTPLSGVTVTQLTTGTADTCALGSAGPAYCWGLNGNGQLGNNTIIQSTSAVAVTPTGTGLALTQVTAGTSFACELDTAGAAWCWGLNANGQLGNNSATQSLVPVAVLTGAPSAVPTGMPLIQIDAGQNSACAQDSPGTFYCWGLNAAGQLGDGTIQQRLVAVILVPQAPTGIAALPGDGTASVYWIPPAFLNNGTIIGYLVSASPGGRSCSTTTATTCTITGLTNGTPYTITVTVTVTTGASSASAIVTPRPPETIAAGAAHTCIISGGLVYCWGDNTNGELGNNSTTRSLTPVAVQTAGTPMDGKTIVQIVAGTNFTCALDNTGAAYCWGLNSNGQLGDGDTSQSLVPGDTSQSLVPVAVSSPGVPLAQITASLATVCALDSTGAAWCWGQNLNGQLGNNSTTDSSVPVPVLVGAPSALTSTTILTQITEGNNFTCALDSTGAAYCWGLGANGQRGTLAAGSSTVPVAVYKGGVLSGVTLTQIAAGGSSACALGSTGLAYCWGIDSSGQLGNSSTTQSLTAVAVNVTGVLANVTLTQITAGLTSACAVSSTGVAYCWGDNSVGELGNNSTTKSTTAVAVLVGATSALRAGVNVIQIVDSNTGRHVCATDSTGTAYCWGANGSGQLGNNTIVDSHVATLLGPQGPTGVGAVAGDATAAISWTAPAFLNNGTITGYAVTTVPVTAGCSTTTATSCTISGLTDGTTYTITVKVTASTGTASGAPVTVRPVGFLTLTSPTSLTWAITASGIDQNVVDTVPADQKLTATDNTATGAGWHITLSATTFSNGTKTLPDTGAMDFTGSTSSLASTAPSAICVGPCTLPTNTTAYPVIITTDPSTPPVFTIYDTSAGTGTGVMTLGGSGAAHPIGWWVHLPATTLAGAYTSTVALTMVSGP